MLSTFDKALCKLRIIGQKWSQGKQFLKEDRVQNTEGGNDKARSKNIMTHGLRERVEKDQSGQRRKADEISKDVHVKKLTM